MITRRQFFKIGMAGTALMLLDIRAGVRHVAYAAIPGGTLTPSAIAKFQTPLLVPPAMPRAGKINARGAKNADYYEIAVRQFEQQILPPGLPKTTVWGYGPAKAQNGPQIFNAPSLTIEAKHRSPVVVKWINQLRTNPTDPNSAYLPHLLPVDPTLHWANPPGGIDGRDRRPSFESTPEPYTGPVPLVTHVHGAVGIGDESDGYAEAWYLPKAAGIPQGYATEGTWYSFFKNKALTKFDTAWDPGSATFVYPNTQRASTIWYHDHALGMTRLNVYAGPAGFFIIRGGPEGDGAALDTRTGARAVLPGPAPALGDAPNTPYYEIPLAIQDRAFNTDGSLFYPDSRAFFDDITGPYIPTTDVSPIWNPEFFGNCMMVNGNTWPYLTVEQRRYRFRILNGCNSRFLILSFGNIPGVQVWQIGNEGGFLAAPVNITANSGNTLLLGPAERADVIVDFGGVQPGEYVLGNIGPDEPFGGGIPGNDFEPADLESTGQVMQFRVVPAAAPDLTTPPQFLGLPLITPLAGGTSRPLALLEKMSEYPSFNGPAEAVLGTVADDMAMHRMWGDQVTENPASGATEVWEFYNFTADAHPMHIHDVLFQVVDREPIEFSEDMGHIHDITLQGGARPPEAWENGWKETVIAYPGEVTRVRMRFEGEGQYVWHCHIVEHEDNEMMRPYRIGPIQPGQPEDGGM
ncbi:MAG: Spore coat protein [Chloroflexota bacterium]